MKRHLFLLRKLTLVLCVFVIAFLGGVLVGGNTEKASAKTWTDPRTNYTYSGSWSGSAPKYICASCRQGWDNCPSSHQYHYANCSGGGSYTCSHGYYSSHEYVSGHCSGGTQGTCEHGYNSPHRYTDVRGNSSWCSGGVTLCPHGQWDPHDIYSTCSGGGSYCCQHGSYGSCGIALYTTCSGTPEPAIAYINITSAFYNSNGTLVGNNLNATTYNITYPSNPAYYYIGQGSSSLLYEISGYTFLGWENPSSDIEGDGNNRNVKSSATTDQSITAKYTRNYRTLKISGGGGYFNDTLSTTLLQKTVWENSKVNTKANLDNLTETTETLPTPKRKGYTFIEYQDSSGGTVTNDTPMV